MTILREWRAEIRRALKDEYIAYVRATGVKAYRSTPGNLDVVLATRDLDAERTEIVLLTRWTDRAAIEALAGKDIARARYFPEDDKYLLTHPDTVLHYDCADLPP